MLQAIVDHGPISREDLAAHLERAARGGSWNTGMKTLRDNDLVTETGGLLGAGPAIG